MPRWNVDVAVVGAGFAGLAAARELTRRGHDVLVLEGRDRVGGRSHTGAVAGVPVDLGGTFVGPTQDAVLGLAAELAVPTVPTYHHGANRIRWRGRVRSYRGTIPKLSLPGLLDIARVRWQFERIARAVPLVEPWAARRAEELDSQSLGGWLRSVHAGASTRDLLAIMARVTWGCEPDDVSMLHAARYVRAAGGLDRLLDVEGGAQQDRFAAGTQQIAEKSATELGERLVLDAAVSRIDQHSGGVTVSCEKGRAEAQFVIVAIPPAHRAAIEFAPPLPAEYQQLPAHWPQGRLSKAYAAYPTPFWRANGLSGQALSDQGPVFITFDVSPAPSGPGILLGFADARSFDPLPADERRRQALAGFASLFGHAALSPIDYIDFRWGAECFAAGGPTAAVPPGSWTRYGPWLRRPVGRLHWADTETADEWTGFLDGAVRSGLRAAAEVAERL
ncbi:flavin monoamine oxidase family protein [Mycobacterium xenopi]|uniref:flavin monoamine oxidase family protein n=1 Tax=Mycobacterium xenopi TaxID=1789 RepID=UPI000A16BE32|nr:flavin monoamine oxidase family protein [Mycobacterium xenopi]MDA3638490.1 flavin monoamine oxidase family protein [Mycobacterium xenopi]MDA3656805.1 flavin monoamine oxidase family protein [Mycobacterium xenopi]MDA3661485.1 flavin monoamine oxidase family protein [Mycobacterium xenopi]ORX17580.1 monooxygenase [Mycobacterium xenopi]SPX90657.1 flavin-containing monoamine oxidase AofH [Mycobacterium xenopi]